MRTHYVWHNNVVKAKNITLSMESSLIEAGREIAREDGTSLNEMIREFLREKIRGRKGRSMDRFFALAKEYKVNSGGYVFNRDDAYDG